MKAIDITRLVTGIDMSIVAEVKKSLKLNAAFDLLVAENKRQETFSEQALWNVNLPGLDSFEDLYVKTNFISLNRSVRVTQGLA